MFSKVLTSVITETNVCNCIAYVFKSTDQVLSPFSQAVVHSDLLPLGNVSDGNNDQPHLAATVDLSDAAVGGGREGAGCWGRSRGCWGSRSYGRRGQRRSLS